ncbi:amidase family protein [Streptomyces sp. NPDC088194]|uniref:amidase family protein n=1 Tax=Streptomyces sp. NPDC088194 TaxID=3154931 RepID=UPI003450C66B
MTPAPLIDPFVPWLPADTAPAEVPAAGTADQDGPVALAGARLAVKDVIDVQGAPTGSGHPLLLAAAAPAPAHAAAVARLLSAGARYAGKTHTDELAYSLGGTNAHYGTPANPAAPGRLTGGSSSGTAAAVAGGLADVGLGTDTAGSIRVPASYCGLYGLRPTHARADRRGIAPLAPSFDTPALLTRTLPLLTEAAAALLAGTPRDDRPVRRVLVPADLWGCAADGVRAALRPRADRLGPALGVPLDAAPLFSDGAPCAHADARDAFTLVQAAEVWRAHGPWVRRARPVFGPHVAERLARAERVTPEAEAAARATVARLASWLHHRLDGAILAIPATPTPAPPYGTSVPASGDRAALLALTCVAGLGGLPALTLPVARVGGLPVGLCLLGGPGADECLLRTAPALRRSGSAG